MISVNIIYIQKYQKILLIKKYIDDVNKNLEHNWSMDATNWWMYAIKILLFLQD